MGYEKVNHTFSRFALAMCWDYAEANPVGETTGGFAGAIDWVAKFISSGLQAASRSAGVASLCSSATALPTIPDASIDVVITDPPYYDAIPYGDLSDFFYVWLRRCIGDFHPSIFGSEVTAKDGELVQKRVNHSTLAEARDRYERGMANAFKEIHRVLSVGGLLVIVFAHKDPVAWETLLAATIQAGFSVKASWPIDTELANRMRAQTSAALASSVWLVCEKRPLSAGVGRYTDVRSAMRERISERMRYFWDQGLSGPDFVWAAIGPALESYSRFTAVRRLDGSKYSVDEFLREVRRLVTDFALGQILHGASTETLDEWTRYYLMHRHNFGLGPAPSGECILLSEGYGVPLADLRGPRGILAAASKKRALTEHTDDDAEGADDAPKGSGSELCLLGYEERRREDLGEPHPKGGLPYIDMLHRLLRFWAAGQSDRARDYVQRHGLRENGPFWATAQAVLEMAEPKSRERSHLEAVVAWGRGRTAAPAPVAVGLDLFEEGGRR